MIICNKCGAIIPDDHDACLICGTKSGETPPQAFESEYVTAPVVLPTEKITATHQSKILMRFFVIISGLLVLSSAAVIAIQILPYYLGTSGMYRAKNAIIYTTADGSLKFISPTMDMPEVIAQISGSPGVTDAAANPNGKYIAYLTRANNADKLYLRYFSSAQPNDGDIEISSDAASFFFTESGSHLIYLTKNGGLYSYDFTKSQLLDENVGGILDCKDGKLLYVSGGKSGRGTPESALFVGEYLSGANNRFTVAEDVAELIDYTPAFDRFIFTVSKTAESGNAVYDVAAVDLKQGTRYTLATGAEKIIAADAKSFTALYQMSYSNPLRYDNIINDDLAREDEKISEPDLDDFPLLKEFYDKYGNDAEYEGSMEFEDIAEESAKLDMAIAAYDKMRENRRLRQKISTELDDFINEYPVLYDLYLCRDGDVERISESSYSDFSDAKLDVSNDVVSWRETGLNMLEKKLFSQHNPQTDISALLAGKLTDKLYIRLSGKNAVQIRSGESEQSYICGGWQLTDNADGVFFAMIEGTPPVSHRNTNRSGNYVVYDYNLYYYDLSAELYGRMSIVDRNVSGVDEMLDGNRLLYFKDVSGDIGDLYMFMPEGSGGKRIGEYISLRGDYFMLLNDGKTLLFCERFNNQTKSGNLFMYTNQSRQLATEVHKIYYLSDSLVYFTRNPNSGKSDLYSFGTNGLVLADIDVTSVFN